MVLNVIEDHGPIHGYEIKAEIERRTDNNFNITEGALYPTLKKLMQEELIEQSQESSSGGRIKKLYRLTERGSEELDRLNIESLEFAALLIRFVESKPSLVL